GEVVVDAGCGCGALSFVAALGGAARVLGCDASQAAVECARYNASVLGFDGVAVFALGDLLEPAVGLVGGPFGAAGPTVGSGADVVIGDVAGIPDALGAVTGWYPGGRAGGLTGAELPMALISQVPGLLRPGGRLYLPTATLQDEPRLIDAARAVFGKDMELVTERLLPLPAGVAASEELSKLVAEGTVQLVKRRSRVLWRLAIWRCTMPGSPATMPGSPPP
ncbi:MAG: methyltransferase domain-containing protein, partial [Acidimicrobiales bacterium]